MTSVVITGAASGLGAEIANMMRLTGVQHICEFDHRYGDDVRDPHGSVHLQNFMSMCGVDILINCAAINKINWLESVSSREWDEVVDTNAKGIFLMSKYCLDALIKSKGTILNIVSNAAHMPMTCSLAYNASKAAAHIMTLQLARELTKKHGITVFGVAPNKMHGTRMSDSIDEQVVETRGWTKEQAQAYQLAGLLTGEETPVENVAKFICWLLSDKEHHRFLTGCVLPYGS